MICSKCGHQNADGMRFCEMCGTPLQAAPQYAAPQPQYVAQPQPQYAPAAQAYSNPPMQYSPVIQKLRKEGTSPLFLTGAIAYSCAILFALISAFTGANSLLASVTQLLNLLSNVGGMGSMSSMEMNYLLMSLDSLTSGLRGAALGGAILTQLPNILVAVGIWLVFATAFDKSGQPMKTTGLTMIKVVKIIQLVGICLGILLLEIGIGILASSIAKYDDSAWPYFIGIMIGVLLGAAVGILFFVKIIQTINTIANSIRTQQQSNKVSVYVAVMCMIAGVWQAFTLVFNLGNLFGMLSLLGSATASIVFSIFLFKYRSDMGMALAGGMLYEDDFNGMAAQYATSSDEFTAGVDRMQAPPAPPVQPQNFPTAETTVLNVCPETTVLNAQPALPTVRLIRDRTGSVVVLDRPQLHIGRDPSAADYIVADNTAVGRHHADLFCHDGGCYVVDCNSTNHTYLNGQQLTPGVEYPLQNGDTLLLGDESFHVEIS